METTGLIVPCSSQLPMITSTRWADSLSTSFAEVFGRSHVFAQSVRRLPGRKNPGEARQMGALRCVQTPASSASAVGKSSKLERIELCDTKGVAVSMVGLWESRTAVVGFARHFGCILCRKRAALLESRKAEMDAAGVALVLIAPGDPEQARKFVERTKFTGEVYADPYHASYEALEFVQGVNSVVNPNSGSRLVKAFIEGFRQDWELSLYKDTVERGGWQQGGILVAGPGIENVRYFFKDAEAGDEPNLEDIISACCIT